MFVKNANQIYKYICLKVFVKYVINFVNHAINLDVNNVHLVTILTIKIVNLVKIIVNFVLHQMIVNNVMIPFILMLTLVMNVLQNGIIVNFAQTLNALNVMINIIKINKVFVNYVKINIVNQIVILRIVKYVN